MTDSPFDKNFRSTSDYVKILEDFLVKYAYKHNLRAPDIAVIATALGVLGTFPIRKGSAVPETAEALIAESIERGKEAFKVLSMRMATVAATRRHGFKAPVVQN